MSELSELYQEMILDHNKNPRNFGELSEPDYHAEGHNPLCGDEIDLDIKVNDDGVIEDVKYKCEGCAISKASASIMSTILIGKTMEESKKLFEQFHDSVTSDTDAEVDTVNLGKLAVFAGVREFPARIKCASLPWHTLMGALKNKENVVTTE